MCNENQTKPDVYDWVLSPEIREHMRTARPLTVEEKADIIDSGCRPIVDKYAALTAGGGSRGGQSDPYRPAQAVRLGL